MNASPREERKDGMYGWIRKTIGGFADGLTVRSILRNLELLRPTLACGKGGTALVGICQLAAEWVFLPLPIMLGEIDLTLFISTLYVANFSV